MQDPLEREQIATEHAQIGAQLQAAIVQQRPDQALTLAESLTDGHFFGLERNAIPGEIQLRMQLHEIVDSALRSLVLADDTKSEAWRRLMLPDEFDLFDCSLTFANARWLRLTGSEMVDQGHEALDASQLSKLGLKAQALRLGRFCVVNDGACSIDYNAIREALDPRLLPIFHDWILSVHSPSPGRIDDSHAAQNQDALMEQFLAAQRAPHAALPASSNQATPAFRAPYQTHGNTRAIAVECNGHQMSALMQRFKPTEDDLAEHGDSTLSVQAIDAVPDHDELIVCPHWHPEHVIFRCASPLVAGMHARGAPLLRVYSESMGYPPVDESWRPNTFDITHDPAHILSHLGAIDGALAKRQFDFVFYPEIVPVNSTCWMATERIARVQATGYGFPVTTGLRTMDYFIGGADVERRGAEDDYCEQLILIPGMGVNTTRPPLPSTDRQRPIDAAGRDGEPVRIVTTTSHQKLNNDLLCTWNEIMGACPNAHLDLFTNMTKEQAALHLPALERMIGRGDVTLHTGQPRQVIIDAVAEADIYLDAFPYGGFNSLVEPLSVGCPVISLEGHHARSRLGAALLRRAQLPELLIPKSVDQYIEITKQLIDDAALRADLRTQVGSPDELFAKLNDPHIADHMDAAITWMRERGPRKSHSRNAPVLIQAGEKPTLLSA